MDQTDLHRRFAFHKATEVTGPQHQEVRSLCRALAMALNTMLPEGREKALAITHLEEVMLWSNAAIARADINATS
jgi:hypothetical protein